MIFWTFIVDFHEEAKTLDTWSQFFSKEISFYVYTSSKWPNTYTLQGLQLQKLS